MVPGYTAPYLSESNQTAKGAVAISLIEEDGIPRYLLATRERGEVKISIYDSDVVRVQWHWGHVYPKDEVALDPSFQWPGNKLPRDFGETIGFFFIRTPKLEIRISRKDDLRVDFYCALTGSPICLDKSIEYNPSYDARFDDSYENIRERSRLPRAFKVKNTKFADPQSGFFGLGDWAGPVNRRGHRIQFWNDDSFNWHEFQSPKYTSFPILYNVIQNPSGSAAIYAIFFNNTSRTMFDLGARSPDTYSFEGADGQVDYFFIKGEGGDFYDITDKITALTGRSAFFPKWSYGYQLGRFTYTEREMYDVLGRFYSESTPLSAIYIDLDYMDQSPSPYDQEYHLVQFEWNPVWFPSPRALMDSLGEEGVGAVIMVEPFIDTRDGKFKYAEQSGYFIRSNGGDVQRLDIWCAPEVGWLDFTNPEAARWWQREVSQFVRAYGIRGIWNDLNEGADTGKIKLDGLYNMGGRFPDRGDSRGWHLNAKSTHPIYSTRVSHEALKDAWPGKRPFVLGRGGFPGVQRYSAVWSGDNRSDANHLFNNIRAGASMAICGLSNYGHDVGGFTGNPSFELFQRWHEWSAFSPLMRNHSGKPNPTREPYKFPHHERVLLNLSIRTRYYFLPHIYSLARECSVNGMPINSPVVARFPNSLGVFSDNESDFMIGRDVLVAPVTSLGTKMRKVFFPEGSGRWHSFWDDGDVTFSGGEVAEVDAPLGRAPVFVKEGGIVVVNPEALGGSAPSKDNTVTSVPEVHVWPGGDGKFTFFDDDGDSDTEVDDDQRYTVHINNATFGEHVSISLRAFGNISGRQMRIVLRGKDWQNRNYLINGKAAPELRSQAGRGIGRWTGVVIPVDLSNGGVVISSSP
jgi:alpha-glucosidase